MFQKKSKTLHLIYILSILCKNTDIVQHIYKMIKNDHFYTLNYNRSFHICLSFQNNLLYSKYVKNIDNEYYYTPPFIQSSYHYWKPVKLFSLDDNYHFNFFSKIDIHFPINTNQFMATRTPENSRAKKDPYATKAVATAPVMGTANTANKATTPRTHEGNRGDHDTSVNQTDDEASHEKSLPLRASELNDSSENTPTGLSLIRLSS